MKCTHCPEWESEMKVIAEVPAGKDAVRRTYSCKRGHFVTVSEATDAYNNKYPQAQEGVKKADEERKKLNQAFGIQK